MYQQPHNFLFLTLFGLMALPGMLFSSISCTEQHSGSVEPDRVASQPSQNQQDKYDEHAAHKEILQNKSNYQVKSASYNLPNVKLIDIANQETLLPAIFDTDKPTLVNFIFTTCTTICPVMTATFSQFQDKMGMELTKVQMISITIDPEQDTTEKLLEYAFKYQAAPVWNFYTGNKDDVIAALTAFDAYRGDKMNHEPVTLMRKGKNSNWIRLEGLVSAADLVAEYQKLTASN